MLSKAFWRAKLEIRENCIRADAGALLTAFLEKNTNLEHTVYENLHAIVTSLQQPQGTDAGPSITLGVKSKTQQAATPEEERPQEGESSKPKQSKEKRKRQGDSIEEQGRKIKFAASVQPGNADDKRQGQGANALPKGGAPSIEKKKKKKQSGGASDRTKS